MNTSKGSMSNLDISQREEVSTDASSFTFTNCMGGGSYMDYIVTNGELYHYGVKGMKWGIRNKKDTITKRDRKLYNQAMGEREQYRDAVDRIRVRQNSWTRANHMVNASYYQRRADKILKKLGPEKVSEIRKQIKQEEKQRRIQAGHMRAKSMIEYHKEKVNSTSPYLDKPYRQPINNGESYVRWKTFRAYHQAEIDRITKDINEGKPYSYYDKFGYYHVCD